MVSANRSCNRGTASTRVWKSRASSWIASPPAPHQRQGRARFIRTLVEGWAYGRIFRDSRERQGALPGWLAFYNRQRSHGGLDGQAPYERLLALT